MREGGKDVGMQGDRKKGKKGGGEERRRKSQVACTALDICSLCHICPWLLVPSLKVFSLLANSKHTSLVFVIQTN